MGEAAIARWVEARQEPDWLRAWRGRASEAFERLPVPYLDRTDLRQFPVDGFAPPLQRPAAVLRGLDAAAAGKGVIFAELEAAAREYPELVQRHLFSQIAPEQGKFEALHAAAWTGGCLLYVPAHVEVEGTLEVVYRVPAEGSPFCPHTLLVLERGASASVVQQLESEQDPGGGADGSGAADGSRPQALVVGMVEAVVADGARLRFADLQNLATDACSYVGRKGTLARDAELRWIVGELGGRLSRSYTSSVLRGQGGNAESLLVFFASGRQHLDMTLEMVHHGAHTNGEMVARGALKDQARTVFRGVSDIKSGAKQSNSQQRENTLHLSDGVRSDAIPSLYIDEFELAAGHAATVGRVDETQLFYLKSRGLPEKEALRLIVHGFFAPLLAAVPLEGVREALVSLIEGKLGE